MPLIEQVSIDLEELERLRRCTNLLIRVWADWRNSENADDSKRTVQIGTHVFYRFYDEKGKRLC